MIIEEANFGILKSIPTPDFHHQVGIKDFYIDSSKIQQLGWSPKMSVREGIKSVIEHYKKIMVK
ncbi:MAG: hypothetical protein ACFFAE_22930, partial [Candidatus Hodarchaeota archaeon]